MLIISPNRCTWRRFTVRVAFALGDNISGELLELESSFFSNGGVLLFALSYRVQSRGGGDDIGRWDFISRRF